jgi:hypothetical protein
LDEGPRQFLLLLNGIDHNRMKEAMILKEMANDTLLFPDTGMVARTLAYTPSNSTMSLKGCGGTIAQSIIMAGTKCHQPTFIKMTKLVKEE